MTSREQRSAGPFRRLAAMLYDAFLVFGVGFGATLPFIPFIGNRVLVPREVGALAYFYWIWISVVIALFFGFSWTRKGATLGMQAWRLKIETLDAARPTWRDALSRLFFAVLPWLPAFVTMSIGERSGARTVMALGAALLALGLLNYFAAYFDDARRAWHDRFLKTRIVERS